MSATKSRVSDNREFLRDLFSGPFRGHALTFRPPCHTTGAVYGSEMGDYTLSDKPISLWLPHYVKAYEEAVRWHDEIGDDSIPYVTLNTNTGVFAAAFGCPFHVYNGIESPATVMPIVSTGEQADRLTTPSLDAPTIRRTLELAALLQRELGPEATIGTVDTQSPFDIAALIWRKENLFCAMLDEPDAVQRLACRCADLLKAYVLEFKHQVANPNLCYYPYAWAPPELGMWLSEDEVGSMSCKMFDQFVFPLLEDLSTTFGGLFMHCCASADHQYGGFCKVPNLRGLNRVFQAPGPEPAIKAFSGRTVLVQNCPDEAGIQQLLDLAQPNTRYHLIVETSSIDEARRINDRLRPRLRDLAALARE